MASRGKPFNKKRQAQTKKEGFLQEKRRKNGPRKGRDRGLPSCIKKGPLPQPGARPAIHIAAPSIQVVKQAGMVQRGKIILGGLRPAQKLHAAVLIQRHSGSCDFQGNRPYSCFIRKQGHSHSPSDIACLVSIFFSFFFPVDKFCAFFQAFKNTVRMSCNRLQVCILVKALDQILLSMAKFACGIP